MNAVYPCRRITLNSFNKHNRYVLIKMMGSVVQRDVSSEI